MRQKIVAANWKMNKDLNEGLSLIADLKKALATKKPNCKVIIAPPYIHLSGAAELIRGTDICLAAQNVAKEKNGAFTGEVSAEMLASTNVSYVLVGHSERRAYYGECSSVLLEKIHRALESGLNPIFCVGEQLAERESGQHFDVVRRQLEEAPFTLDKEHFAKLIIAYEPVWAIGTGKTATPEIAEEMHAHIRRCIAEKFGKDIAEETSILYGGSCNASNAVSLFKQPDVDGGLIGGASLSVEKFMPIIEAWDNLSESTK